MIDLDGTTDGFVAILNRTGRDARVAVNAQLGVNTDHRS